MAAVDPPTPTYKPKLPRAVIEKGLLSEAQLEAVVYAGEAHSEMLPAAEGEQAYRKGYFDGDGTGVGKGRTIAGIILDNWNHGRKKAVWVSEKQALIEYAKDDWSGLEQKPDTIFNFSKVNTGEAVKAQQGIGFITYDTLKGGLSAQQALARGKWVKGQKVQIAAELGGGEGTITGKPQTVKGTDVYSVRLADGSKGEYPVHKLTAVGEAVAVTTRIDQIVEWFGKDFDGVIAFDEAHNMGNADRQKGDYRTKEAALKALAGLELQQRLPNARVLYVSATGATEVSNLAYAERLGLWGRGTAFASKNAFVAEIGSGGVAAMEIVARDMKQLGLYTARGLSYDGALDCAMRRYFERRLDAAQYAYDPIDAFVPIADMERLMEAWISQAPIPKALPFVSPIRREIDAANRVRDNFLQSTSWKITAPLRAIASGLRTLYASANPALAGKRSGGKRTQGP
jgi:hypothetical protein